MSLTRTFLIPVAVLSLLAGGLRSDDATSRSATRVRYRIDHLPPLGH